MQITFQLVVHELQQQLINFCKIYTDALHSKNLYINLLVFCKHIDSNIILVLNKFTYFRFYYDFITFNL